MSSVTSLGFLSLRQDRHLISEIECSDLDIVICFASWDTRSIAISHLRHCSAQVGIIVSFANKGATGRAQSHASILTEWLSRATRKVIEIEIDSLDERQSFEGLAAAIGNISKELQRPLNILLDFSSGPKAYTLSLIARGLKFAQIYELTAFYCEPSYELRKDKELRVGPDNKLVALDTHRYEYTEGDWRPIPLPYLEGEFRSGRRKRVIASLGFESVPSYQLVAQYEPEDLVPVLAEPGFVTEYTTLAHEANDRLIASFGINDKEVLRYAAGDVVTLFADIVKREREKKRNGTDVAFLCFGLKTHALGLSLAAIVLKYPIVVGRVPKRFLERETRASSHAWVYRIGDTSIFTNRRSRKED